MSSIEWLVGKLNKEWQFEDRDLYLIEKAKEMEKAEHAKTWDAALDKYEVRAGNYMRAYEDFDDYYNENFKL